MAVKGEDAVNAAASSCTSIRKPEPLKHTYYYAQMQLFNGVHMVTDV